MGRARERKILREHHADNGRQVARSTAEGIERAVLLNKTADRVEQNLEALATLETTKNGKPIRETTPSGFAARR